MRREHAPHKPHLRDPGIGKNVVGAIKVGDFRLDSQNSTSDLVENYIKHLEVGCYILRHKINTTYELWVHAELIDIDELIRSNGDTARLKQSGADRSQALAKQTMSKEISFFSSLKSVVFERNLPIGMFNDIGQLDASRVCAVWGDLSLSLLDEVPPSFAPGLGSPLILVSYDCNSGTPYEVRSTGLGAECAATAFDTFDDLIEHLLLYKGAAVEKARLIWGKARQSIKEIDLERS